MNVTNEIKKIFPTFFLTFPDFSSEGFRLSFIVMIKSAMAQEIMDKLRRHKGNIETMSNFIFMPRDQGPSLLCHRIIKKKVTNNIISIYIKAAFKIPIKTFVKVFLVSFLLLSIFIHYHFLLSYTVILTYFSKLIHYGELVIISLHFGRVGMPGISIEEIVAKLFPGN